MADIHQEIKVDASLNEVYAFLANPENRTELYVNVAEVTKLGEGEGWEKGDRFKEIRDLSNRKVSTDYKIVDLQDNQRVVYESSLAGMKMVYEYFCEEVGEGTRVRFTADIKTTGIRTKLTRPLLIRMLKKEEHDHLINLYDQLTS